MASKKIDYNSIAFKNRDIDRFSTRFGNGDPIKLKDSPLSGPFFKKASEGKLSDREKEAIAYSNGMGNEKSDAQYMANTSWSAADRIETKNALKKSNPESLSKYGYQTTNKGNVVDEQFKGTTETDAKRLRQMATRRPIAESSYSSEQSLRGRKLAEGIQTPSMTKSKKPVIAAPKIDTKAAKAQAKADAQKEFYINSKGVKVYR